MLNALVSWLVSAPSWQLMAAVIIAVIGLYMWLKFIDDLDPKSTDQNENYNYQAVAKYA